MTDFVTGVLGTACVCSMGILLSKLCSLNSNVRDISPGYLLISKDHYDMLRQRAAATVEKKCIIEQPPLPNYSECAEPPLTRI